MPSRIDWIGKVKWVATYRDGGSIGVRFDTGRQLVFDHGSCTGTPGMPIWVDDDEIEICPYEEDLQAVYRSLERVDLVGRNYRELLAISEAKSDCLRALIMASEHRLQKDCGIMIDGKWHNLDESRWVNG